MPRPRVLIGYSCDRLTREAFEAAGCDAWTCDLLPARGGQSKHILGDIWETALQQPWDFAVLHPMCTYLTTSAAWAYGDGPYHMKVRPEVVLGAARRAERERALGNFRRLLGLPFPVAIENPAHSFLNTMLRRADFVVQPYEFGDDASKATGFWLNCSDIPHLFPTEKIPPRIDTYRGKEVRRWGNQAPCGAPKLPPSTDRWLLRSATFPGIAAAMGDQWGHWLTGYDHQGVLEAMLMAA